MSSLVRTLCAALLGLLLAAFPAGAVARAVESDVAEPLEVARTEATAAVAPAPVEARPVGSPATHVHRAVRSAPVPRPAVRPVPLHVFHCVWRE